MAELRWNPMLKTWTMVNSNRQKRPDLPKDWCPFCPGDGKKVPAEFDVYKYDNDFPVFKQNPDVPTIEGNEFYKVAPNYGKCEVILYSSDHNTTLSRLSVEHIVKLINLWIERNNELSADSKIQYVFIFENRGEEVGATMIHPHGQIYAFSYIPQKLEIELNNCREHHTKNNTCLICDMNKEEAKFQKRMIFENTSFYAYLPYFTDYPYGVFIVSKRHLANISELSTTEKQDLAETLSKITGAFDKLFDKDFPYMMVIHQTPVNSSEYKHSDDYYHFHIEFYPPLRSKNRIKFYASSELGAWATANPLTVEETATELREALVKLDLDRLPVCF